MDEPSDDWSLDEWEYIPDHKVLLMESVGLGGGGKDYFSSSKELFFEHNLIVDMNYFVCTPHNPPFYDLETKQVVVDPLLHMIEPITTDKLQADDWLEPNAAEDPKDIGVVPAVVFCDQDVLGSPEFSKKHMNPDTGSESCVFDGDQYVCIEGNQEFKGEPMVNCDEPFPGEHISFNLWKWRVNGIGALCSLGFAAATICIILFGGKQQQHKMQLQIYADDKRIKQVMQQASRLNQAMSAVRGSSLARANITFGGYYDGL